MKPRLTTIVLILALIVSNLFWLYGIIDQGVTITYMESSIDSAQSDYKQIFVLANSNLVGLSASDAMKRVEKDINGLEPFLKEGCLNYGQVCLRLNSENVIVGFGENAL